MEDIPTIDETDKKSIAGRLLSQDKQPTMAGALEAAKERGVRLYPVSFNVLLDDLAEKTGNPRMRGLVRMHNTMAVALSLGLLGVPPEPMLEAIGKVFEKNARAAGVVKQTAEHAYSHAVAKFDYAATLPPVEKQPRIILANGFHGTALGKIACGCRLQAYYPITPATDESFYLESNAVFDVVDSRPGSIAVVQTEDELSAIGVAAGGSLTGVRSSVATSGPGLCLMVEILGWAAISETPLVITDYQRSGPSSGIATKHGQDDLVFSISAGHGDLAKIVYASGTIGESFYDTGNCFNYADIFQVPVIHLMDRFLVTSVTTCKRFEPRLVRIKRGKMPDSVGKDYRRFEITEDGISPRSRLGLDDGIFWTTGTESNEAGHLDENPAMRMKMMHKRMSRLGLILKGIPEKEQVTSFGVREYTVVSWGSAKGPIIDAIKMLKRDGIDIGFVQIKLLHPFPADLVTSLLKDARVIIDVEANYSAQLASVLKQNTGMDFDYHILKYNGRAMTCTEVYGALKKVVRNEAEQREILTYDT